MSVGSQGVISGPLSFPGGGWVWSEGGYGGEMLAEAFHIEQKWKMCCEADK